VRLPLRGPSGHLALAVLAALVGPAGPAAAQHAGPARHPLWAATDGDNTVYLLGSLHLLRADAYPLPAAIEAAYADAERVAFEVDYDALDAAAPLPGRFSGGHALADAVAPETGARLDSALAALDLPAAAFASMKPWLASVALAAGAVRRGGYAAEAGLDRHFFERAGADGKPRLALETAAEQFAAFDGVPAAEQEAFLRRTLDGLPDAVGQMDRMTAAWRAGDEAALEAEVFEGRDRTPVFFERLLDARNRAWLPQVEGLLARAGEDALVVVGAGHLVGPEGLVALLRARGYRVEQR
jgi:uncharacterized protein YbaP (TraB family)